MLSQRLEAPEVSESPMEAKKKRVLVIDDEMDLVELLMIRLRSTGFNSDFALDGRTGLEKVRQFKPDVILLDILLPGMNGWEVFEKLRNDPVTKSIPVVIITALQSNEVEDKAIQEGAQRVVLKPYNEKELVQLLAQLA